MGKKTNRIRARSCLCLVIMVTIASLISCGEEDFYQNAREPVFIMDTGIRYHLESCRFVTEDADEVYLGYAVDHNFTRCPVCRPPMLIENELDPARDFRVVLIGGVAMVFLIVGGPFATRHLICRRRALHIVKCRFGDRWRVMLKSDREQEIANIIEQFKHPSPVQRTNDE